MDVSLSLWSDGASLCVFDPEPFIGTKPADAWPHHANPGVRDGLFVLIGLQRDGGYVLRLADANLSTEEQRLLNDTIGPLGVVVRSGQVYVSGMDLPGELPDHYRQHGVGMFVSLAAGEYDVFVHELRPVTAEQGIPDYVAVFRLRTHPFPGVMSEPRFAGGREIEELIQRLKAK